MRHPSDMHLLFESDAFVGIVREAKKRSDKDLHLVHEESCVYLCPPSRLLDNEIPRLKPYAIYNWQRKDQRFVCVDILDMSTKPFRRLIRAIDKARAEDELDESRVEIMMSRDRGYCYAFIVGYGPEVSPRDAYNQRS